ncbi:hypothetical protein KQP61_11365 [Bacteroides faecis]|jgi:hypothetical protein|uniref:hypothetical protein n=1 Tax=Bacteroides faecis TaxID=674529 RepID=UPI000D64B3EF|nr:hypothetical protein [Bacteroides faecis]KAA5270480.1 hypothetical protein F2Z41_06495 [Bacteroides faecis]MCE9009212.1 hypothetical protein [Bacteroides faecis]MCS2652973.1 hypothetical protein [Bacteroides faecis]RYT90312.1 hypothetical protein EAJ04_06555 [Bacteroides faecis]UYU59155.1 hypothetical protein KQP61_11365 [Bacteroides faecis]
MEAFGFVGLVYLLAGIIQLVILIVLIVKFLQLTTDVKQLKNLYAERSRELSSSIDKLSSVIKEQSNSKDNDKPHVAKDENIVAELKKEPNKPYNEAPAKEVPTVDENSDDFKQHLRKWKILKNKGYTEQAIREYMEYTKRDMNSAVDFINSI